MLIRALILLCILLLSVSGVLYLFTDNPRYLDFAWKIVRTVGMAAVILVLLIILERYALVGWGVLRY